MLSPPSPAPLPPVPTPPPFAQLMSQTNPVGQKPQPKPSTPTFLSEAMSNPTNTGFKTLTGQ